MLTLTVTGFGAVATPDHPSTAVYAPRVGFSRLVGDETVQGVFKPSGGRCAIALVLIAGSYPARLTLSLAPNERVDVSAGPAGHLGLTCGQGGRSLIVASSR